jgi:molybdopterin synthase catalytic subunit
VRVFVEGASINPEELRGMVSKDGCGSIVSFVGITRGKEGRHDVYSLEFDAWGEKLPSVLESIAERAISDFGVSSVVIAHRTGTVLPGEAIVCIHVGSEHRREGFQACSWLIDELKGQAPLWKKETRSDGVEWKGGMG